MWDLPTESGGGLGGAPRVPRAARGAGAQGGLPLLLRSRVWTKGHVIHRGPSVNHHGHHQGHPAEGGRVHAGVLRDSVGQGSQAHGPASALGRRGTDDGQRQRLWGRQEVDGPAQPGDRGPPTHLPPASVCPSPARKVTLLPPHPHNHPPAPQKHTGAWKEGAAQVTARGPCGPRTASVYRQPPCSQLRG